MLRVKYVGDPETFDPIMSLAGRRGGSPRLAYPDGTAAVWKMGLLGYQKTEGSHG